MNTKIIPVFKANGDEEAPNGFSHRLLRLYQVFVNVEGVRVPLRHPMINILPWVWRPSKLFGFYSVIMLAAGKGAKPPMLLSMAQEILSEEFASMSKTPSEDWVVRMEQWRETGVAPPMFQQPGCVNDGWGAAWYEMGNEREKGQRYRLTRIRLWKGRRAKPRHASTSSNQSPDSARKSANVCKAIGTRRSV